MLNSGAVACCCCKEGWWCWWVIIYPNSPDRPHIKKVVTFFVLYLGSLGTVCCFWLSGSLSHSVCSWCVFFLIFLSSVSRSASASSRHSFPDLRSSCTKGTYSLAINFAKQSGHLIPLWFWHSVHLAINFSNPHGGHGVCFFDLALGSPSSALLFGC